GDEPGGRGGGDGGRPAPDRVRAGAGRDRRGRPRGAADTGGGRRARRRPAAAGQLREDRLSYQTVPQSTDAASAWAASTSTSRRGLASGVAAAAAHARGTKGSQMRSVSALVKPRTAAISSTAASASA